MPQDRLNDLGLHAQTIQVTPKAAPCRMPSMPIWKTLVALEVVINYSMASLIIAPLSYSGTSGFIAK